MRAQSIPVRRNWSAMMEQRADAVDGDGLGIAVERGRREVGSDASYERRGAAAAWWPWPSTEHRKTNTRTEIASAPANIPADRRAQSDSAASWSYPPTSCLPSSCRPKTCPCRRPFYRSMGWWITELGCNNSSFAKLTRGRRKMEARVRVARLRRESRRGRWFAKGKSFGGGWLLWWDGLWR